MKVSIIRLKKNRFNPRQGDIVGLIEWLDDKYITHVKRGFTIPVLHDIADMTNDNKITRNDHYVILRDIVIEPFESFKKEEFQKFLECFSQN